MPLVNSIKIKNRYLYVIYGATIFLSAFLLFHVQPLISKFILPWFGGTASVWTICMLFFQSTLLLGYLYAYLINKYLPALTQIILHIFLLILAILLLPVLPDSGWRFIANDNPIYNLIFMLTLSSALPLIMLSATSPLLQSWFSKINLDKSPYTLYTLSNAGSFLALFIFPLILEPLIPLRLQSIYWSILFGIFVILYILASRYFWGNKKISALEITREKSAPKYSDVLLWLCLSASTVILLLAITNKISEDIPITSILWILPLGLYLFSYVIIFNDFFKNDKRIKILYTFILGILFICYNFFIFTQIIFIQLAIYLIVLLFFCLVIHRALYLYKPSNQYLAYFYVIIALGGVLGSIIIGIIAPLVFNSYLEMPLIIYACLLIIIFLYCKTRNFNFIGIFMPYKTWLISCLVKRNPLFIALVFLVIIYLSFYSLYSSKYPWGSENKYMTIDSLRNFFGVMKIKQRQDISPGNNTFYLFSGTTIHGVQTANQPKNFPTSYYGYNSGIALAFNEIYKNQQIKIGVLGLGAGSIAAYGKKGDYIKFYEINEASLIFSRRYFTYLTDSLAQIEISLGDGRILLEKEPPQNFDILVLDAFTGDALPLHLLTKEAFDIYLKHLQPSGIIAIDISNRYLDLTPVILKMAENFDLKSFIKYDKKASAGLIEYSSKWVLLSKNPVIDSLNQNTDNLKQYNLAKYKLWTDDYSNIFQYLK